MSSTAKSWIRIATITALGATADVFTDGHLNVLWEWLVEFGLLLLAVILLVDECVARVATAIHKAVDTEHKRRHLRSDAGADAV